MLHHFCPVRFVKSAQNQPICWVLLCLKGMHLGVQLMPQACQSFLIYPQHKWNVSSAIITSMDRGTTRDMSFLSCAFLLNLPKTSPCAGNCGTWKGCILACNSYPKLANSLPCTQKTNAMCQQQSSAPWKEAHTKVCHFCPVRFCQIHPKSANPMGAVGPERGAF